MDIRIVNTCNNNCLYCLENSLRSKEKYISKHEIYSVIGKKSDKENISFYWWNPLLHPDLQEIIAHCKQESIHWISLLSNSYSLNKAYLGKLIDSWLNGFSIYFNSFDKQVHQIVNWWGIWYKELLKNLEILSKSLIKIKAIIHVNNLNIKTIARDILVLNKKYEIKSFDFINYFPFDRPYENRDSLQYSIVSSSQNIKKIFEVVLRLWIEVNFLKFPRDFFLWYDRFYNFNRWIIEQMWKEDILRLDTDKKPFCYLEQRCSQCFIRDNCKFYG